MYSRRGYALVPNGDTWDSSTFTRIRTGRDPCLYIIAMSRQQPDQKAPNRVLLEEGFPRLGKYRKMEDQNCGAKEGKGGGRGTPGSGQIRSEKGGSNQQKDTYSEGAIDDRMSIPNQVEA